MSNLFHNALTAYQTQVKFIKTISALVSTFCKAPTLSAVNLWRLIKIECKKIDQNPKPVSIQSCHTFKTKR